jgi:predicted esterase
MSLQTNGAPPPSSSKPAILCLHGGGTNASIFKIQTIRIQRALSSHFEFVFLDAPFECGPGPGVVPVFEGCGPYFSWITTKGQAEKPERTRDLIERCLEAQREKDGRGFIGVLGFSQGARVAAGLLLEHQLRKKHDGESSGLDFGVFMNGTCPPLTSGLSDLERTEQIDFFTLSVLGIQDPWREDGRRLYSQHCNRDQAVLMEFDVGHRLPLLEEDTARIAEEMLRMFQESGGGKAIELNEATI